MVWLRLSATSRTDTGWNPDEVFEIFPTYITLPDTLWSRELIQPLTDMNTKNLSGNKARPALKDDNLIVF
jgi:hypothetical protein